MQGGAWQNRPDGDRTDNLKHSIHYFDAALPVYRRLRLHRKVYHNSYMLGVAWGQLREGDRGANIEKALGFYRVADGALDKLTNDYPADRAKILRSQGLALIYRRSGNRAVNLEDAIVCLYGALKVFEQQGMGIDEAKTRNYLAGALLRRDRGTDKEDVETAIEHLRKAADVLTKEKFDVEWAQIQHDLGTAYRERIAGDAATNLKESMACYKGALSVRVRMGRPDRLATTLNGFGRTMLTIGDRDGNTATCSAISLFDDALRLLPGRAPYRQDSGCPRWQPAGRLEEKLSPAEAPEYLAETSANLGDAWCALTTGDRNRNRRIAAEHFRTAVRYYARIPYYFPEYSATLRKLELLSEKEPLPGRRVAAQ
jgi:tetratricopeptide (TPR) repeat protein